MNVCGWLETWISSLKVKDRELYTSSQREIDGLQGMCVDTQGDGTAVCLQGNPAVFTLSMHAANNFPARKQKSTLDVPLPDGMQDNDYLRYSTATLMSPAQTC